jgi:hypothetical protein
VILLLITNLATAQLHPSLDIGALNIDAKCAPEVLTNRKAIIDHDGTSGLWYQMPVGLCMMDRLALLPSLVERIQLLENRRDSSDELIHIQQSMVDLSIRSQKKAEAALMSAVNGQREAEEKLNHWTNSPWLWASVGGIVTFAITLIAIWALDAATGK